MVNAAYGTVGIDGEDRDGLRPQLWKLILREEEMAYLDTLDRSLRERRALAIFSAKESLYKAQYPRSGSRMSYHQARVEFGHAGSLTCTFEDPIGPFPRGYSATGRWLDGTAVVTAVWMPLHLPS